ncbi:cytochrome P450 [Streptomyces sp. NPDC091027]|uniref:cytochrome P450 n=1 Tax=Streptomyces sp. NPDC091027 TaxID=3365971 RepID=UPI003802EBC9
MSTFPWARASPLSLPDEYTRLLAAAPVSRHQLDSGRHVWVVAGHHLFRKALLDPAMSADHAHPAYPTMTPVRRSRPGGGPQPKRGYSGMDPPEHTVHRRLISAMFSDMAAERLRPTVRRIVSRQLDAFSCGPNPADLVTGFADRVPAMVIAEVLGMGQRDRLAHLSRLLVDRHADPVEVAGASTEIRARIAEEVCAAERSGAGGTLLGRMVGRYRRTPHYDRDQVVELVGSLIIAGTTTTANMISLGVLALLRHPDQLAALRANPALVPMAVDELLRYLSIADLVTARVTTASVRLGDVVIPGDEGVVFCGAAANHDPRVFERPARLDIHRDARRHVAFGYGVHRCIGQHLARIELAEAFGQIFRRFPGMRPAGSAPMPRSRDRAALHGLTELVVTW